MLSFIIVILVILFIGTTESISCDGVLSTSNDVCNKHGVCVSEDTCTCYNGWKGTYCDTKIVWNYVAGDIANEISGTFLSKGTWGGVMRSRRDHITASSPEFPDSLFILLGWKNVNYADVWEYSLSNDDWRWIAGSSTDNACASREGDGKTFHANNEAGGRTTMYSFLSGDGQAVYFGSGWVIESNCANTHSNSIWAFNFTLSQFREVREARSNDFGSEGVFSSSVAPPPTTNWNHNHGVKRNSDCGLFGFGNGDGVFASTSIYSDLWEFCESTEYFRRVKGPTTVNYAGDYGNKGLEDISYYPRARHSHASFLPNEDEYWIFGGYAGQVKSNDLWRYRFSTNSWTWISGSSPADVSYSNAVSGSFDPTNNPGSNAMTGGLTIGDSYLVALLSTATYDSEWRNAIWVFSLHSNGWLLYYGDPTSTAPPNVSPNDMGGRQDSYGAMSQTHSGSFYFIGGMGRDSNSAVTFRNDVWEGYVFFCYDEPIDSTDVCSGNGICVDVDSCLCFSPYSGNECNETIICQDIYSNETTTVCSGHGECVSTDECSCDEGYVQDDCSEYSYFNYVFGDYSSSQTNNYGCDGELTTPSGRSYSGIFYFRNREIYLFGGVQLIYGYYYNDVWKYDVDNNQWCFISGDQTQNIISNYLFQSTLNVFSIYNQIGSRAGFGSFSTEFSFFVFGGLKYSYDETNELWEYSIIGTLSRHQWRKLYDHNSDSNSLIQPSARNSLCSSGYGFSPSIIYIFGGLKDGIYYNDLWRYNLTDNVFTRLSIGDNLMIDINNLPSDSEFNETNIPMKRMDLLCWVDQNENFFIFGGKYETSESGNDVWIFNTTLELWAFVSGGSNNSINQFSSSGSYHSYDPENLPALRNGMISFPKTSIFFTSENAMIFYGGRNSLWENGVEYEFIFGDLWEFSNDLYQFKFLNGSSSGRNVVNSVHGIGSRALGVGVIRQNLQVLIWGGLGMIDV